MRTFNSGSTGRAKLLWAVLALCWLALLFDGFDLFMYGAVLPDLLADRQFGLTEGLAGTLGSVATFGMLIGALCTGIVTDRWGRRRALIGGVLLFSIASAVCAAAPTLEIFGLGRFVGGLGLGGLIPTAIAMILEFAPLPRRNLMIATLMTGHNAGGILAATAGIAVVPSFGWRAMFWLGAAPLVLVIPAMLRWLPESFAYLKSLGRTREMARIAARWRVDPQDFLPAETESAADQRTPARASLRSLLRPGTRSLTLFFWLASFFGLLLVYGVSAWLPSMMKANGYELGPAIGFLLAINAGGVAGMLLAGPLADRWGALKVALAWFALTAVGVLVLGIRMPLVLTFAVAFATGVWLFSAHTMVYASVGSAFPVSSRATAIGWTSGVGRLGAVVGPWLGGVLAASAEPALSFAAFASAGIFGAIALVFASGRIRRTSRPQTHPATAPKPLR